MDSLSNLLDTQKIIIEIQQSQNITSLEKLYAYYLGKKGVLTDQLKKLKNFPPEKRQSEGKTLNQLKNLLEQQFVSHKNTLQLQHVTSELNNTGIDITLPGRGQPLGHLHPITQTKDFLETYFGKLGFIMGEGPEIEDDFHNFTALNIPPTHPARAMHDTFYFPDGRLLRTHTSPVQIRVLESQAPPVRIIAIGRVYRCDSDLTHTPMFHQIEGLLIDENISLADLKGLVIQFLQDFFEKPLPVRFRPSYFPFTEPSAEVDMGCVMCDQVGCRVCKNTGWLEIGGCGMVHPNVLKHVNVDAEKYTGYAFGMGIDRLTMLRHGINDLRLFFENDCRFLKQF